MKKCPSCNQTFTDDYVFCMNDGTTLLLVSDTGVNLPVFPTADNATTQVVSRPQVSAQIAVQAAPKDTSKWLFLIIGVLATAVVGMGIFMFTSRGGKDDKTETANQNSKTEITADNANRVETGSALITQTNAPKTNQTVEKPKINPNLNPAGNWTGSLTYQSGASFSGQLNLTDEGSGRVRGQIVWTFTNAGNRSRADKVGLSATEFVQGSYDAATRTLLLNGYSESDAYDLIILDKYKLVLAEDNRRMNGYSYGGKTRGNFSLRK